MKNDKVLQSAKNKKFTIPKEGSLGLLALGDVGLLAWRKVKIKDERK